MKKQTLAYLLMIPGLLFYEYAAQVLLLDWFELTWQGERLVSLLRATGDRYAVAWLITLWACFGLWVFLFAREGKPFIIPGAFSFITIWVFIGLMDYLFWA